MSTKMLNKVPFAPALPGILVVRDVSGTVQLFAQGVANLKETMEKRVYEVRNAIRSGQPIDMFLRETIGWGAGRAAAVSAADGMITIDFVVCGSTDQAYRAARILDESSLSKEYVKEVD